MKRGYGQYCPLALAAEILGQRWSILVVSRIIDGCTTYNEIHRGIPRISPSMLSLRLGELERAGIVRRLKRGRALSPTYELTEAGEGLSGIVMDMAIWGQQWARDMSMDDLDPAFLAWSMHTRLNADLFPDGRTVLEFEFKGTLEGTERFWLVVTSGKVDMCLKHPGFDADLVVQADLRRFVESWRGFRDLREEIQSGKIKITGPRALKRAFPDWLLLSALAPYERKRPGREQKLASPNKKLSG
jgi:DNA-binding HxlR family transcriptional regulator